jgi:hypothetical protein
MDQKLSPYYQAFLGRFSGVLRWHQLDELWQTLQEEGSDNWFIYAVGDTPPEQSSLYPELENFIKELNILLRQDHDEDYCGIVYVDNFTQPTFIKIFDPNNLGTSCSTTSTPPLPAWILSKMPPIDLPSAMPQTQSRKRWWKRLFN